LSQRSDALNRKAASALTFFLRRDFLESLAGLLDILSDAANGVGAGCQKQRTGQDNRECIET
jgi:hypothetical protein